MVFKSNTPKINKMEGDTRERQQFATTPRDIPVALSIERKHGEGNTFSLDKVANREASLLSTYGLGFDFN